MVKWGHLVLVCGIMLGLSGLACAQTTRGHLPSMPQSSADSSSQAQMPAQPALAADPSSMREYVLGVGDKIKLTVYGEDDLSGEYEVNSTGVVALPLIGNVNAAKKTIREFEDVVKSKLSEGYLQNPRVSVQVANYRPFFILGEVSKPGSYPYVNGMNVLNAVAMAGGFTYRANESRIVVVHANDPDKKENRIESSDSIMPGDIIRVPERYF